MEALKELINSLLSHSASPIFTYVIAFIVVEKLTRPTHMTFDWYGNIRHEERRRTQSKANDIIFAHGIGILVGGYVSTKAWPTLWLAIEVFGKFVQDWKLAINGLFTVLLVIGLVRIARMPTNPASDSEETKAE